MSSLFEKIFYTFPDVCCFAPGRVNLIGEHTDYNGGYVLPCAINRGIYCMARSRNDRRLQFYSTNYSTEPIKKYDLDHLEFQNNWADYPVSVIMAFKAFGYELERGCDFLFRSNLPEGAGISSSAALEVVTAAVVKELFFHYISKQELAIISQFAENRFMGVNCGIMDQFAIAMGKEKNALFLNSGTLHYEYIPLKDASIAIVIVNSGVKHSLASSAYNQRRCECELAAKNMNVSEICSLDTEEFEKKKYFITDKLSCMRARHAVYENHRVIEAVNALKRHDYRHFGLLMNEYHISLRDQYEVSCDELNLLAETAWSIKGVYGARMTGGGFGGCTVNLMESGAVKDFIKSIKLIYKEKFGIEPLTYSVSVTDGVRTM